ncbi:ABC transporter ATP-binding protein/permease [Mycoplasmopsis agalactiae]|uniref:ABC transporter ATP-binding protein n=1 Tax=Mycoplasmopsis agalactiae TaxID=2110 RepID=UPI00211CA6FD|nr:ABC transporter ATP-binding protein [Mycoplasmopsis agalactiae]UUM25835.1 ABC transporter ATP-binding protein/permease [Mycoplasmopsis agalactiae]
MLKLFSKFPLKVKLMALFAVILSTLHPFLSILIPTVTRQLITYLANSNINSEVSFYIFKSSWIIGSFSYANALWVIVGISFALAFILVIISYASNFLAAQAKNLGVYYTRKLLFEHLLTLSHKNIESITPATLLTRFSNDVQKLEDGFYIIFRNIFVFPFYTVWGLIFALLTNLYLSISIVFVVPFIVTLAVVAIIKLFPLYRKENIMLDAVNEVIKEDFNNISLIKSYNLEQRQFLRFDEANKNLEKVSRKANTYGAINWPSIDLFILLGNVVIFSIVAVIINKNDNTDIKSLVGDIYQFITYMQLISFGIFSSLFMTNRLIRSNISAKRILEILKLKSEITSKNSTHTQSICGKIEFKKVNFAYDKALVLKDVSFVIEPYETVGIIGKTGSGKSTLVRLLTREYKINKNSGEILIDNKNIYDIDQQDFYKNVSVVFQKPLLLSGTIKSNVMLGANLENESNLNNALLNSKADFVFKLDDSVEHKVYQKGKNFSGGQRQRLAIVQALIKSPKILILDDATSALDNQTDKLVRENLGKISNNTTIIISQRVSSIKDCDKIIVMDNGSVSAIGKHNDLLNTNATYRSIYESQEKEVQNV